MGSRSLASESDIDRFLGAHDLSLPADLAEYFKTVNGSGSKYDQNFFQFYSLEDFKSVEEMYLDWSGVPDFRAVANGLPNYQDYFVIADYNIQQRLILFVLI